MVIFCMILKSGIASNAKKDYNDWSEIHSVKHTADQQDRRSEKENYGYDRRCILH